MEGSEVPQISGHSTLGDNLQYQLATPLKAQNRVNIYL